MAELGLISAGFGIASIAIQVADSVMKLKDFIDSVKEAPGEIRYIIRHIETLTLVLSSCDTEDNEAAVSEAVSNTTRTCKRLLCEAAGALDSVVKELELAIGKGKKMGSVKAVLKQGMVDKLRQRLRDAQDLLVLSNQYYSQAQEKRRHEIQRRWTEIQVCKLSNIEVFVTECTEAVRSIPQRSATSFHPNIDEVFASESDEDFQNSTQPADPKNDCKELARGYKRVTTSLMRQREILARLMLPSWLRVSNICVELCGQRSLYGLSLDVKVYRVVPYYAPIIEFVREGNVVAIQEMFSKGTATPNDMTDVGFSILEIAARSYQVEVCRLLIREGAYKNSETAKHAYDDTLLWVNLISNSNKGLDLVRILAEGVDYENPFDLERSRIGGFRGELDILSWILHNSNYSFPTLTVEYRARLAIHLGALVSQPRAASLIRYLLPGSQDIITACQVVGRFASTLIHSATWALGEQALRARQSARIKLHGRTKAFGSGLQFNHQAESDALQDLLSLIRELIAAGSNLHGCAQRFSEHDETDTPFTAIITSFGLMSCVCAERYPPFRGFFDRPIPAVTDVYIPLMMWLELLYEGGIDLVEYGRKEKQVLREGGVTNFFSFAVKRRPMSDRVVNSTYNGMKLFYFKFKYGPKPSDWQFWLIEQMDDWLVEFWDMIEHPERAMPGSWDERFDEWE